MDEVIDDKVMVIDTYGVYMFDYMGNSIETLYDLNDLKTKEDIKQLRQIVLDSIGIVDQR